MKATYVVESSEEELEMNAVTTAAWKAEYAN